MSGIASFTFRCQAPNREHLIVSVHCFGVRHRIVKGNSMESCTHIEAVSTVTPAKHHECEECVKIGSNWVHLRTCQTCGVTLCCDSSRNRHATKHARATSHPVIASAEPGERWLYCYPDDAFVEY